jgi:hypothetical protein
MDAPREERRKGKQPADNLKFNLKSHPPPSRWTRLSFSEKGRGRVFSLCCVCLLCFRA